jgi:hypothetical protein
LASVRGRTCGSNIEEVLARTSGDLVDGGQTADRPIAALIPVEEVLTRTSGDLVDGGRTAGRPIAALIRLGELAADAVPPREESA